jgi:hypothetical protein
LTYYKKGPEAGFLYFMEGFESGFYIFVFYWLILGGEAYYYLTLVLIPPGAGDLLILF